MRYRAQQVDLPFVAGIDESADERMQKAGAGWSTLDNWVFDKDARLAKRPRFGYNNATAKDIANVNLSGTTQRLTKLGSSLCYATRERLYQRSQTLDKYAERGRIPECGAPTKTVVARNPVYGVASGGVAVANGYSVYCWIDDTSASAIGQGNLHSAIYSSDGQLIWRAAVDDTGYAKSPRVFSAGNYAFVVWATGSASPYTLKIARLDCSSSSIPPAAWDSAVTVSSALGGASGPDVRIFDACSDGTSQIFVVYYTTAGDITWARFNTGPTQTHSGTAATAAVSYIAAYTDGTHLVVGFARTIPLTSVVMRSAADLTPVLGTTTLIARESRNITFSSVDASTYFFALGEVGRTLSSVTGLASTSTGTVTTSGTVTDNDAELYHWLPASKLFTYNSKQYIALTCPAPTVELQSALVIHEIKADEAPYTSEFGLRPVCALNGSGLAPVTAPAQQALNQIAATATTGEYRFAAPEYYSFSSEGREAGQAGLVSWGLSFVDPLNFQTVEHADALHSCGGVVGMCDGQIWAENGFAYAPVASWMLVTPTAGASVWKYVATYVWQDATGRLHESAPSIPLNTTGTTPVTVTVPCLTSTYKQPSTYGSAPVRPVAIRIYRTLDNGTTFYQVGETSNTVTGGVATYTDTMADSSLDEQPVLYTDGNVIGTSQLFAGSAIGAWDDRVWVSSGSVVRCSKRASTDRASHFVDHSTHEVATRDSGAVTALATMDDALVIFKGGGIYLLSGSGPGATGVPVFPEPRSLATDVGCSEPRSVVLTGRGLVFQSPRGVHVMPRGFGDPEWLGARARDHLALYPTITGSCVVPESNWVLWATTEADLTNSRILCWDYARNVFTTWSGLNGDGYMAGLAAIDGSAFFCSGSPVIFVSDSAQYATGENFVTSTIESTKMRPNGLVTGTSRVPRVRILGEFRGSCVVTLKAAYNDGAYDGRYNVWTLTGTAGDKIHLEWTLPVQKVGSLQLWLYDGESGEDGYTDGVALNAFSLDVATRPQRGLLHAAAKGVNTKLGVA